MAAGALTLNIPHFETETHQNISSFPNWFLREIGFFFTLKEKRRGNADSSLKLLEREKTRQMKGSSSVSKVVKSRCCCCQRFRLGVFIFGHFPLVKEGFFLTQERGEEMEERQNFVSGFSLVLFRRPGGWAMATDKTQHAQQRQCVSVLCANWPVTLTGLKGEESRCSAARRNFTAGISLLFYRHQRFVPNGQMDCRMDR